MMVDDLAVFNRATIAHQVLNTAPQSLGPFNQTAAIDKCCVSRTHDAAKDLSGSAVPLFTPNTVLTGAPIGDAASIAEEAYAVLHKIKTLYANLRFLPLQIAASI